MSNNKKGKSLRKILTTAYTAVPHRGFRGWSWPIRSSSQKSLASSVTKRQRQRTRPQERAQAVRERRETE